MTNIRRALQAASAGGSTTALWIWGRGQNGVLGIGNLTNYSSPKQVGDDGDWADTTIVSGYQNTFAVKPDGTLWAWGDGNDGNGGWGDTLDRSSPIQIGALTDWSVPAAGASGNMAIKTDGTLWAWGGNQSGVLGLGTAYPPGISSPVQVGSLTDWKYINCGPNGSSKHALAVKTDGTLWSWGRGTNGTLGLGNTTSYSSPKQVGALTDWLFPWAGSDSSACIKTDGTLWMWGSGGAGQLGLGNVLDYSSPKQVGALTDWSTISAGFRRWLAIKTDGTMWSWGDNAYGEGGTGNTTTYSSPVQVGALTTWSQASAQHKSSFALRTDGTLWSFGKNNWGQLGQGNLTNYSSPKQVGALTTWTNITSGRYFKSGVIE
tara:strand:- start:23 stop:1147 length:1125 start_codon:yes stop_codon:yes gene_type:complete